MNGKAEGRAVRTEAGDEGLRRRMGMKAEQIYTISGTDYQDMTRRLLAVCGLEALLREKWEKLRQAGRGPVDHRGLRIAIKPNLVSPSEAAWGATTHPEIVAGIIESLQALGCEKIGVMEGSWVGDRTQEAVRVCGYDALCERCGVPFLDMQKEKGIEVEAAGMRLRICRAVQDVDFLINVPVLKGHCQTKVTCALKNMKGLLPNAEKRRFHAMGLHKPIAHLNAAIRQDLVVVDHICGDLDFEDGGNPVVMNRILAGTDPVLLDAYAAHLLHYETEEIPYIPLAAALGVGCGDISRARIIPVDAQEVRQVPLSRKVVEVSDCVEEVDSCSACYGYLLPALDMLRQEMPLSALGGTRICIGQGWRGKSGELGIGSCTRKFRCHLEGCPPTENQMVDFLRDYIEKECGGADRSLKEEE